MGGVETLVHKCARRKVSEYAMLSGPTIYGDNRSGYLGTIEYTHNDYIPIWTRLLDGHGRRIACLEHDEGAEFTAGQLSAATLPWEFWAELNALKRSLNFI